MGSVAKHFTKNQNDQLFLLPQSLKTQYTQWKIILFVVVHNWQAWAWPVKQSQATLLNESQMVYDSLDAKL